MNVGFYRSREKETLQEQYLTANTHVQNNMREECANIVAIDIERTIIILILLIVRKEPIKTEKIEKTSFPNIFTINHPKFKENTMNKQLSMTRVSKSSF